jgi:hypothetical protein
MPLKPGQIKDLKLKIFKSKELDILGKKLSDLTNKWIGLMDKSPSKISKKAAMLATEIEKEQRIIRKEIDVLEKKDRKKSGIDKIVNAIAKDCSQILPYYRKSMTVLLRGVTSTTVDAYKGRSWINREPTHSNKIYQELYDRVLAKNGFKALRSNSIFTTGHFEHAAEYGKVYIIFPKNGFAYHWNKEMKDLVIEDPTFIFKEGLILDIIDDANEWYSKTAGKNIDWGLYDVYRDPQNFIYYLKQIIKYPKASSITVDKLVDDTYIMKRIGPTKTNFLAGLESNNEMMISGEYYAIRFDSEIADYVLDALKINAVNLL